MTGKLIQQVEVDDDLVITYEEYAWEALYLTRVYYIAQTAIDSCSYTVEELADKSYKIEFYCSCGCLLLVYTALTKFGFYLTCPDCTAEVYVGYKV